MALLLDLESTDIEQRLRDRGLIDGRTRLTSLTPAAISAPGLMGSVIRVLVKYDPPHATGPRTMILKTPSSTSPLSRDMSRVEARFYAARLADESSLRVPDVYYCRVREPLLLLEDLGEDGFIPQIQGCSEAQAMQAIREIAKLHARWWNVDLPERLSWIEPPPDSPAGRFCAHWLRAYEGDWPSALGAVPEILRKRYDEIRRRLASAPATVIHGDFHSGNISFGLDGGVTLVDFHRVERATGMVDVARFLATSLRIETRRAIETDLLAEYLRCLEAGGVTGYAMNSAVADLRPALLWIMASPIALHIRGIAEEGRSWPTHFPILERCLSAIQDWDALAECE